MSRSALKLRFRQLPTDLMQSQEFGAKNEIFFSKSDVLGSLCVLVLAVNSPSGFTAVIRPIWRPPGGTNRATWGAALLSGGTGSYAEWRSQRRSKDADKN